MICDLAQTYHVYDFRALPLRTAAALASGLPITSRVMSKQTGLKVPVDIYLLSQAVDLLNVIRWMLSEDGSRGTNFPELSSPSLVEKEDDLEYFDSPEDFEAFRASIFTKG